MYSVIIKKEYLTSLLVYHRLHHEVYQNNSQPHYCHT